MKRSRLLLLHFVIAAPLMGQESDLERVGYALGAASAETVVIQFVDFSCSVCGRFARSSFPVLRDEYVNTGLVRWVIVPFVLGSFRNSEPALRAAVCAGEQGRFWEYHDRLFSHQAWQAARDPAAALAAYARELGADERLFAECYAAAQTRRRVRSAGLAAANRKVNATPTFFIHGTRVIGAPPLKEFRQLLGKPEKNNTPQGDKP